MRTTAWTALIRMIGDAQAATSITVRPKKPTVSTGPRLRDNVT
jgi:hypothetical protein